MAPPWPSSSLLISVGAMLAENKAMVSGPGAPVMVTVLPKFAMAPPRPPGFVVLEKNLLLVSVTCPSDAAMAPPSCALFPKKTELVIMMLALSTKMAPPELLAPLPGRTDVPKKLDAIDAGPDPVWTIAPPEAAKFPVNVEDVTASDEEEPLLRIAFAFVANVHWETFSDPLFATPPPVSEAVRPLATVNLLRFSVWPAATLSTPTVAAPSNVTAWPLPSIVVVLAV